MLPTSFPTVNRIVLLFHLLLRCSDICYYETSDVRKLCELRVDLRTVPKQLFEKRTNSKGLSYYHIPYYLAIIPTSGYMYFQLEFNGTTYGKVQAEYY